MKGKLTEHFTWEEVWHSDTANKLSIENTTHDADLLLNIQTTAGNMEAVRLILEEPIIVSSWFRSKVLNVAVGGSRFSAHSRGLAVVFTPPLFGTPHDIVRTLSKFKEQFNFVQLICEDNRWVHIGWPLIGEKGRGHVLTMTMTPGRKPLYQPFV